MALPRSLPIASEVLKQAQFTSLQERMSKDLFAFDAEQRKNDDALSLENIGNLHLPEDASVTGTTGYEGMLGDAETPDVGGAAPEAPDDYSAATAAPRRTTGLMSPTVDMPEFSQPRQQPVYDPTQTVDIQGEPDYDPSADMGTVASGPVNVPNATSNATPNATPADASSWEGKAYAAAVKAGHPNPTQFAEQMRWESGNFDPDVIAGTRSSSAGAQGIAQIVPRYHPGVDPLNPDAALDYAARLMKSHYDEYGDSDTALAAYNGGAGAVAAMRAGHPYGETQQYLREVNSRVAERGQVANPTIAPTQRAAESRNEAGETRLSRVSYPLQQDLTDPDKWAVCGPLAAMAMASANGTPIDYETAKAKARAAGWSPGGGMAGPSSQVALLNSVGVPTHMEAVNWEKVQADVRNGNPVTLSSPGGSGHYFVVQGVDDQGRLDLGNSALTLKGGRRWMTPDEMRALGPIGAVDTAIYMDNPSSPTPSRAAAATGQPSAAVNPNTIIRERDALALTAGAPPAEPPFSAPADASPSVGASPLDAARTQNGGGQGLNMKTEQPGTADPIQNPDGSVTTERSITVTDPRLNGGRATNIPTVWGGHIVSDDEAVQNAAAAGMTWPSFGSIDEAVRAAEQRSEDLGAGRATSVGGATVPPEVQNAVPYRNRPVRGGPVDERQGMQGDALMLKDDGSGPPARDDWRNDSPYTDLRVLPSGGVPATSGIALPEASATPAPARDDWRTEQPLDPDQGPHELIPPGAVSAPPIISPLAPNENPGVSTTAALPAPPQIQITAGGPPTPSAQFTEMPTRPTPTPAAPQVTEQSTPWPQIPGLQPVLDTAGNVVAWVQGQAQAAGQQISENMAGNRQAVEDANAGREGGVDFGTGAQNAGESIGNTVGTEGIATPISHAISDPINAALGQPPAPRTGGPETGIDRAFVETGRSLRSNASAVLSGLEQGGAAGYGEAALGALGVLGDLAPSTTLARQLNEMLPTIEARTYDIESGQWGDPLGEVGVGDIVMTAALGRDALRLGYGAIKAGGRTWSRIAQAIREGVPAERFSQWVQGNAERVAAADARAAERGSVQAPGVFGVSGIEPNRPEVQGMRPRVIPPNVVDELDIPVRNPTDPHVLRAIEAAGGTVDETGTTVHVIRNQGPEAHGGEATRDMVFYIAGPPGTPNPYASSSAGAQTGGPVRIEGWTKFRSPLILSDAPGGGQGFNEAMQQMGVAEHPRMAEAKRAMETAHDAERAAYEQRHDAMQRWYDQNPRWTEEQADAFRASPEYDHLSQSLAQSQQAHDEARAAVRAVREAHPEVTTEAIEAGIREARRAGPEGSPARAQALKDLVARYGGNPDRIDALLAIRGADASESAWAIKENIVATNARKQGYDGVVTVQPQQMTLDQVKATPEGKALSDRVTAASKARDDTYAAYQTDSSHANAAAYRAANAEWESAREAAISGYEELRKSHKITELADTREARNPTPGEPTAALKAAYRRAKDAEKAEAQARNRLYYPEDQTHENRAAVQAAQAELKDANAALDALMNETETPPGYTLRSDIPRRAPVRESTIEPNPRVAAVEREYQEAVAEHGKFYEQYMREAPGETFSGWARQSGNKAALDADTRLTKATYAYDQLGMSNEGRYVTAQVSAGALPASASTDRLSVANRVLGQGVASAVSGGVGAQVNQEMNPDDPYAGVKGFAVGAVAPALIARGAGRLARAAGREAEGASGALATFGGLPQFPGVKGAVRAAERRQATMKARGLETPSGWDWIKQAGYAGIYGPATFVNSVVGGAQELILGQPKEAIRALVAGRPSSYVAQARAQLRAMPDGLTGLAQVVMGGGSKAAAAVSGGSQGTANLSERIVNPAGHGAARLLERPGEILTEAPDAVFRPMFTAQGMEREARTIAAEMGMKGQKAAEYADLLMDSAEELRAHPTLKSTSAEARRVVAAGAAYADKLGYKGDPGGFGRWLGQAAKRDDGIGVLASFLVPFPSMAGRMTRAAAQSTPGVGLLPAIRRGQATKFDVVYDQAFGTAVAAGVAYWAFNGGVTGSGPADQDQRKLMIADGWQPNSTLVGNHYIPNRVFGRFQPLLDAAGELHDALAYKKSDYKTEDLVDDLVKRGSRIATDQVGLSGLADLHDMWQQGFSSQLPGWAARSAMRYIPYAGVLRAAAASSDTVQRRPDRTSGVGYGESFVQNAEVAVPGLRQNVPATQDVLGREVPNPQQGFGALIPRTTTRRDDPILGTFRRYSVDIPAPRDYVAIENKVPEKQRPPGQPSSYHIPMTPEQTREWNAIRGQEIIRLTEMAQVHPQWADATPGTRQRLLQGYITAAAKKADAEVYSRIDPAAANAAIRGSQEKASEQYRTGVR